MAKHLMVRTQDIVDKGLWRLWPVINCDKTKDIPVDYPGAIGVPITYMGKHDPERFELLGMVSNPKINGQNLFKRLVIRNLHPDLPEVLDLTEWFERMGEPLIVEEGQEMSVLIKGMEMPKGCWWRENGFYMECPLFDADHYCSQLRRWIKSDDGDRPHDCPLVEVPTPHGRLIDADAIEYTHAIARCIEDGHNWNELCVTADEICDMPTIIEAEEGEER